MQMPMLVMVIPIPIDRETSQEGKKKRITKMKMNRQGNLFRHSYLYSFRNACCKATIGNENGWERNGYKWGGSRKQPRQTFAQCNPIVEKQIRFLKLSCIDSTSCYISSWWLISSSSSVRVLSHSPTLCSYRVRLLLNLPCTYRRPPHNFQILKSIPFRCLITSGRPGPPCVCRLPPSPILCIPSSIFALLGLETKTPRLFIAVP